MPISVLVALGLTHTQDLENLDALKQLVELRCGGNLLSLIPPISLPSLTSLDLGDNKITSHAALSPLAACRALSHLILAGNPLAAMPSYRADVRKALPNLSSLDGIELLSADDGTTGGWVAFPAEDAVREEELANSSELLDVARPPAAASPVPSLSPREGSEGRDAQGGCPRCEAGGRDAARAREEAARAARERDDAVMQVGSLRSGALRFGVRCLALAIWG